MHAEEHDNWEARRRALITKSTQVGTTIQIGCRALWGWMRGFSSGAIYYGENPQCSKKEILKSTFYRLLEDAGSQAARRTLTKKTEVATIGRNQT